MPATRPSRERRVIPMPPSPWRRRRRIHLRAFAGKLADVLMVFMFSTLAMFACWALQPDHQNGVSGASLRQGHAATPVHTPVPPKPDP